MPPEANTAAKRWAAQKEALGIMYWPILLVGGAVLVYAAIGFIGGNVGRIPERMADDIVRRSMRSPDSFVAVDHKQLVKGTYEGHPAYIIKINYNGLNGFGATIRQCSLISFHDDGQRWRWHDTFGVQDCSQGPYLSEADEVTFLVEANSFKGK